MNMEQSFDEDGLLEEARTATGLADFGASDFLPGLRSLCATYASEVYSEKGKRRNRRRLVQLLSTRLRVQAAFVAHPEILEREVAKPMVLTGMPRSGTSALFNLLGSDPAARPLRLWETQFPDPMELEPGQDDPRRAAIEAHYAKGREKNPDFTKIHYTSADTPEECVLIHAYAMNGVQMGVEIMLEPYGSWYREQDLRAMYAYQKDLLKLLDWQRPGDRWLLKAPAHMWGIEALVAEFPDVSIVWSHRNPMLCTASICSMTEALTGGQIEIDKHAFGRTVMDFYATSLERGLAARDRCDPERFVDVTHDEFVGGSLDVARRIYSHFGTPMTPEARKAIEAHIESHPKGKHGSHDYSLEEYGLDPREVRERFASYIDRFQISD